MASNEPASAIRRSTPQDIFSFRPEPADDTGEYAPTYVGSVLAYRGDEEGVVLDHGFVVLGAHSKSQAQDKALSMALRRWPLADDWVGHHAVVGDLAEAHGKLCA